MAEQPVSMISTVSLLPYTKSHCNKAADGFATPSLKGQFPAENGALLFSWEQTESQDSFKLSY